jgi:hypothetical protein
MKRYFAVLLLISAAIAAPAQTSTCLDLADEPHHQLLFSNQDVRVVLLELPRLASTEPHCHAHPYFYVIPGEGRSSTTPEGHATFSHDWHGGETRFVFSPVKHVVRRVLSGAVALNPSNGTLQMALP